MKNGGGQVPASIKDFLAELEDLLESLGHDVLALEDLLSEGKEDPDIINSLFRSFHTVKGLAGMLSLGDIGALSHAMEDLLDSIRLGRVELSEDILQIMYQGIEMLGKHAKALTGGGKVTGQAALLKKVTKALEGKQEAGGDGLEINLGEDILKTLTEYEEHRLKESVKHGKNLFIIHRSFSFGNFDAELNDLLSALKNEGEVVSTLPSPSSEDPSRIKFDLLWSTTLTKEAARAKYQLTEEEIVPIQYERKGQVDKEREAVSASLRSLSETVRVDIKRLNNLMNIVGELVIYKTQLGDLSRDFINREGMTPTTLNLNKTVKAMERSLDFLQKGVIEARMVPIGQMFGKLNRVMRKISRDLGKEVDLKIYGEDTELDKLVIEDMADPLLHLMRNAIDHGIETPGERKKAGKPPKGSITLSASQKGSHILIEIEDDGAGIDVDNVRRVGVDKGLLAAESEYDRQQVFALLFQPGFSTSRKVTEVSGRGVGLDVVKNNVSRLRGMIDLDSEPGQGTKVSITLPMTLAIIQALMVKVADELFAIPISSVLESVKVSSEQIHRVETKEIVHLRDGILPLLRLDEFFRLREVKDHGGGKRQLYVVVVGLAEKRLGLVVDALRGQQEIVIKALGEMLKPVRGIAGATELGDRGAVLVLDVGNLIQEVTYSI